MTFGALSTATEVIEGVDLRGKTVIVTGASTGIGLETASALALAGAAVTLAARTPQKLAAAAEDLRTSVSDAQIETGDLDLASLESVRAFVEDWSTRHDRLHLLVNNAGVMFAPFGRTAEGFETHLGTNYLGHFVLTNLLVPHLVAGAPARVVVLGSDGHSLSDILWDDPNFERSEFDKLKAYGQSKTADLLFALELNRRLSDKNIHAYAVHPGVIMTELGRTMTDEDFQALTAVVAATPTGKLPDFKTIPQGAATTVWAATAPELDANGGAYLEDCAVATPEPWGRNADSAQRLWALSEQLVGQQFLS